MIKNSISDVSRKRSLKRSFTLIPTAHWDLLVSFTDPLPPVGFWLN